MSFIVISPNGSHRPRESKDDLQLYLQLYPLLLLLPERFDGYYDFVCTQLQPHVYDLILLPNIFNNFHSARAADSTCDRFHQYYFPLLGEFAFTQAMLFLPHMLKQWDNEEHPFFARVDKEPSPKDHSNFCSRLALPRLQIAQKLSQMMLKLNGVNTPLLRQYKDIFLTSKRIAAAAEPLAFAESYYNSPHMILLRQYLEMVPPQVIKENWRYQLTLGLMHLYSKNYSAAFRYLQSVQELTERFKLDDFAEFSSYLDGSDCKYRQRVNVRAVMLFPIFKHCFVHDLLANKTIQSASFATKGTRSLEIASRGEFEVISSLSDFSQSQLITDLMQSDLQHFLSHPLIQEWWQEARIEIPPHFFTKIFLPQDIVTKRLFDEYQALNKCLPTLITCCRQGLAIPDFTYPLRKRMVKSAQTFVAAQLDDKANTHHDDYFYSLLNYNYSLNEEDYVYSGSKLRRYTTSRMMWELLQLPMGLSIQDNEMYLSEMPLLAPSDVISSYKILEQDFSYKSNMAQQNAVSQWQMSWEYADTAESISTSIADVAHSTADAAIVSGLTTNSAITASTVNTITAAGTATSAADANAIIGDGEVDLAVPTAVAVEIAEADKALAAYAASYPRELTAYFYCYAQKHKDAMLYVPDVSLFLKQTYDYAPLKGMHVNLNAFRDNLDYEVSPWIYRYVQQHLPQMVQEQIQKYEQSSSGASASASAPASAKSSSKSAQAVTKNKKQQSKAATADSTASSLVPLQIEINNPLPTLVHRRYDECLLFFFPLGKAAHIHALTDGELPEYQMIPFTPIHLQGYHQGELFAADSADTPDCIKIAQKKQDTGIDKLSLRYKILVYPAEFNYCDWDACHCLLNAALGNSWMERHFGSMHIFATEGKRSEKYKETSQDVSACPRFKSSFAPSERQLQSKAKTDAAIAEITERLKAIQDDKDAPNEDVVANSQLNKVQQVNGKWLWINPVTLEEEIKKQKALGGEFVWDQPFYIKLKDLYLLKTLPSWQRFFGYYDHTHLYYNYSLRGLQWPKPKPAARKIVDKFDNEYSSGTSKSIDVKEWLLLPDLENHLDVEQYQEMCATYPWREDIYFGRTACYRLLAAYHQGNRVSEDLMSRYFSIDFRSYPLDSLSRLMQFQAFAGFIMVPVAQLEQSFAQGSATSDQLDKASASGFISSSTSSPEVSTISPEALAALPIDPSFYGQAQRVWDQRQMELTTSNLIDGSEDDATVPKKAKAKAKSKKAKGSKDKDGQDAIPINIDVCRIAYYLSFLQDLKRTLKHKLNTEVDIIGYALGTEYVYLDLIIWDWELFLSKAMPLARSDLAQRYGVKDFTFHSFARTCDALPLKPLH